MKKSFGYWFCWVCPLHKISMKLLPIPIYETMCKVCLADYIIRKGVDK